MGEPIYNLDEIVEAWRLSWYGKFISQYMTNAPKDPKLHVLEQRSMYTYSIGQLIHAHPDWISDYLETLGSVPPCRQDT